ncbi:MAG: RNA methyltransferase PUA domain-containing protein, partial [Wenzhouxiangella sp.]
MRKIRVHTGQPLAVGETVTLEPGPARHLVKVLRQRVGNRLALFNGDGSEYFA